MTDEIKNIDIIAGKKFDEVLNNDQQTDVYDKFNAFYNAFKDQYSKKEPGEYVGYNMYSHPRTVDYVADMFGEKSKFFKEIMRLHGDATYDEDAVIYECKVHIPEVTSVLPLPDLVAIHRARKFAGRIDDEAARKVYEKNYTKWLAESIPEVLKLILYPSFFYYAQNRAQPPAFQLCKVKFTDSLPTRGFGLFQNSLSGNFINYQFYLNSK